jgi:hypothetical protein
MTEIDDCGVRDVPRGSLSTAPIDAARPCCEVRYELLNGAYSTDSDITDMIDWYYVVSYERKLI